MVNLPLLPNKDKRLHYRITLTLKAVFLKQKLKRPGKPVEKKKQH